VGLVAHDLFLPGRHTIHEQHTGTYVSPSSKAQWPTRCSSNFRSLIYMPLSESNHLAVLFIDSLYIVCSRVSFPHIDESINILLRRVWRKGTWGNDWAERIILVSQSFDLAGAWNLRISHIAESYYHHGEYVSSRSGLWDGCRVLILCPWLR
jgi:hypothetical protein